ncbi:MAG TPA: hypothetical protein VIG47_03350, partial [Gemmatimonadaceae bacterium]
PVPLNREDDTAGGVIFSGRVSRETLAKGTSFARVEIETERTVRPQDVVPGSSDDRTLGVLVNWIDLEPTNPYADFFLQDDPDGSHLYRILRGEDGAPIGCEHRGGPNRREEWLAGGACAAPPPDVPPDQLVQWLQGVRP